MMSVLPASCIWVILIPELTAYQAPREESDLGGLRGAARISRRFGIPLRYALVLYDFELCMIFISGYGMNLR